MNTSFSTRLQLKGKKKTNHTRKASADRKHPSSSFVHCCVVALMCMGGCGLFFLLIAAVIAYATPDPNRYAWWFGYGCMLLTSFVTGVCFEKKLGHSVLLCGLLSAGVLLLVCTILAVFFPADSDAFSFGKAFLLRLPAFPSALLGAFMGRKKAKVYKKKRKIQ